MRQVSVTLLPALLDTTTLPGATAVVIDVLRATSVIATALANGARRVYACESIDSARQLAAQSPSDSLLCGERGGLPIDGFDLGNSPAEYTPQRVRDQTIVLTTTNGTLALAAADQAEQVLTASFLNFSAVTDYLSSQSRVVILCAGTNGRITSEDVLLAGAIVETLLPVGFQIADDSTQLALHHWRQSGASLGDAAMLGDALSLSSGAGNLKRIGLSDDVMRVAQVDQCRCVPMRCAREPLELRVN